MQLARRNAGLALAAVALAVLGLWIAAGRARSERDAARVAAGLAGALQPRLEDGGFVEQVALDGDTAGRRPADPSAVREPSEEPAADHAPAAGAQKESHTVGELLCTVVDANDQPAPDAAVLVSGYGSPTFTRIECCTDSAGLLRVLGEMQGRYVLALHPRDLPSDAELMSSAGDATWKPTLRLRDGVSAGVRCRVVRGGVPVAGARVTLRNMHGQAPRRIVLATGDDGVLELFGLWPEEYELVARAPGAGVGTITLALEAGVTKDAEIELAPGVDLHGVVVDASGAGVAGVEVTVRQELAGELYERTESGPDGAFSFPSLHPGRAKLYAWAGPGHDATEILELVPGEQALVRLELVLGLAISGRVVDPAGKPLAVVVGVPVEGDGDLWVCMDGTDDEGRFFLSPVPSGIVMIEVRGPSQSIGELWGPVIHRTEVASGSKGVVLTVDLERALSSGLRGRVLLEDVLYDGHYVVSVREAHEDMGLQFTFGPLQPEFTLERLAAGPRTLSIYADDAVSYQADIELATGQVLDLGTIVLQVAGTLVCEIRGAQSGTRMRCDARRAGSEDLARIIAVDSSRAVAERMLPGSYEVTLYVGSTAVDRQTVEVAARGRGVVRLTAR